MWGGAKETNSLLMMAASAPSPQPTLETRHPPTHKLTCEQIPHLFPAFPQRFKNSFPLLVRLPTGASSSVKMQGSLQDSGFFLALGIARGRRTACKHRPLQGQKGIGAGSKVSLALPCPERARCFGGTRSQGDPYHCPVR